MKKTNIEAVNSQNIRPAHLAALAGRLDLLKLLLDFKPDLDLDAADDDGKTLLHYAASKGSPDTVQFLLEKHVNITLAKDGIHPVLFAAGSGNLDTVKILARIQGIDFRDTKSQFLPIHNAASYGCTDIIEWFIDQGVDINARSGLWDLTPLLIVANMGHTDAAVALLKRGADPTCRQFDGWGALHHGIFSKSRELVAVLIDCKEIRHTLFQPTKDGSTPISMAIELCQSDVVELLWDLVEAEPLSDWNEIQGGATLLLHAVRRRNNTLVDRLTSHNVNISVPDILGRDIMHAVAESGSKYLFSKYSPARKCDEPDCMDERPLHVAAKFNNAELIDCFISASSQINAQTKFGSTPLIEATRRRGLESVSALLARDVDLSIHDIYGLTAFDWGLELETLPNDPKELKRISLAPPNFKQHENDIKQSISRYLDSYSNSAIGSQDRWVCLVILGFLFLSCGEEGDSQLSFNAAAHASLYPSYYAS